MIRITQFRLLVTCSVLVFGAAVLMLISKNWDHPSGDENEKRYRASSRHKHDHATSDIDQNKRPAHWSNKAAETTQQENNGKTAQSDQTPPPIKRVARRSPHLDRAIMEKRGDSYASLPTKRSKTRSNRLTTILGNNGASASQRVTSLASLTSPLSQEEQGSIYQAIENQARPEGITEKAWHWIVDELITALRDKGAEPHEITNRLASIHTNRNQHTVIRDYALQHLGHLQTEGGDPQIIKATLHSALKEKQGTLAGTALLAIQNSPLKTQNSESLAIARDESYDLRSRITAMQVAGKQGNRAALPVATATAADDSQPVALRLAAIATLADLNAKAHQPLIQSLTTSQDSRLRTAARAALKKLTAENQ